MPIVNFIPGQRWVSTTESELGLGIVIETSNRRVEVSFPAAGERRIYAMDIAPLSRVKYHPGEKVSSEDDQLLIIQTVSEKDGCLSYIGLDEAGKEIELRESALNSFVQFSKPQDRLFAGQIDKNRAFELRCETLEHIRHQQQSPARGLSGPRIQLLPHQLYIASETANRESPRVLLADEVGLGKTIEAGLILHHQLVSGRARRVLIVVPDSLLHQWLVELLRRFNLLFTVLDDARCQDLEESDGDGSAAYNPFESTQWVLCTLSFLTGNPQRQAQAMAADWDLLIVDEAHHLQWNEQLPSPAYLSIEALAKQSRGLLLLTATPEQLGVDSHFARLRLLDPDRFHDLQGFLDEEARHQPLNRLLQQLLAEDVDRQLQLQGDLVVQLQGYLGDDAVASLMDLAGGKNPEQLKAALETAIRDLIDRHGTGRVLFRNTRSSVSGFPERKLHAYPLPAPGQYAQASADAGVEELLAPELLLGESWVTEDPRVSWLEKFLEQHRGEKVLVICARAASAITLEEQLRTRGGALSAVFHEGLSLIARDRAAAYFADLDEGAQVLVCSEIGSEGRNFQFSQHLVLFDLPLNPDLLEQRIGRLDRIGQRNTVQIHAPYYESSAQAVLLGWYHEGINAFESTCPAGLMLYEHFEKDLMRSITNASDEKSLRALLQATRCKSEITLLALQQGRDRLLEMNSFDAKRADEIVHDLVAEERRQVLASYMEKVFDLFGVEQEHHSAHSLILRPGDHMLVHSFPALADDGMTATYQRELALSREDMHFLTWEHPMVSGAMDMVLNGEFGNTALCAISLPPYKPGSILLEVIFTLSCTAPVELQLSRYLPLTTVRVMVDYKHNDLSEMLGASLINKLSRKVSRAQAQDLVRHTRPKITTMIAEAESLAAVKKSGLISAAVAGMQALQHKERDRLQALAKTNPHIREEEIENLKGLEERLRLYLDAAQLRLDAIRVVIVSD